MIAGKRLRPVLRQARLAGLGLAIAGLALLQAYTPRTTLALRYERAAIASGEWWRLVTAHVVHHDLRHMLLNVAGLALLWVLYASVARPRAWSLVALTSALAVSAGLWWLRPDVAWYVGLSGLLHGIWAGAGVLVWRESRTEGAAALALLAAKLALEYFHGPLTTGLAPDLVVLTAAHRFGALGGAAAALALTTWARRQSRDDTTAAGRSSR